MAIFDRQSLTSSSDYNTLICVAAGGASATIGFVVYKFRKHYDREKKGHYKPRRPSLIANAEKNNDTIYYFGVGSNMLRSKVEGRAVDRSKIEIISMEPGVVPGYRVAFNMKAFPPMEPAMASIEPVKDSATKCLTHEGAVHANGDLSCHGSLIAFTPEMYNKVYLSEGGGKDTSGYEEIVVRVEPYDENKKPVDAIAFRAKKELQLSPDLPPSARYMSLLVEGAHELGLSNEFQEWLQTHPVQRVPYFLRKITAYNMMFTFPIYMSFPKLKIIISFQSWICWTIYLPTDDKTPPWKQLASNVALGTVLAPGASLGIFARCLILLSGKKMPKMMQALFDWNDPAPIEGHRGVGAVTKKIENQS